MSSAVRGSARDKSTSLKLEILTSRDSQDELVGMDTQDKSEFCDMQVLVALLVGRTRGRRHDVEEHGCDGSSDDGTLLAWYR